MRYINPIRIQFFASSLLDVLCKGQFHSWIKSYNLYLVSSIHYVHSWYDIVSILTTCSQMMFCRFLETCRKLWRFCQASVSSFILLQQIISWIFSSAHKLPIFQAQKWALHQNQESENITQNSLDLFSTLLWDSYTCKLRIFSLFLILCMFFFYISRIWGAPILLRSRLCHCCCIHHLTVVNYEILQKKKRKRWLKSFINE